MFRVIATLMLGCALGSSAHAEDVTAARRHFDAGSKAFALGEFDRAVDEYRAAYEVKPDAGLLYNIAQSYRQAGDLRHALWFYRSYLSNQPGAHNRHEVEERIRGLEKQVTPASEPPPITLQIPPMKAAAPLPEATPAPRTPVVVTPPASQNVVAKRPSSVLVGRAPVREHQPAYKKWWLWTGIGVVAAGVGVGLGLGLQRSNALDSHFGTTAVHF
jgi:hypothetical protein